MLASTSLASLCRFSTPLLALQGSGRYLLSGLWLKAAKRDGWCCSSESTPGNRSLSTSVLPVSPALEAVGISDAEWRECCRQWGLKGLKSHLEDNLEVLERWGMHREARKKVALGTLTMLNIKPQDLERKLAWLMKRLDFKGKDVLDMVERHPEFLGFYPQSDIMPFVDMVTKEGYSREDAKSMILRHPPVVGEKDGLRTTARFFEAYLNFKEGGFMKAMVRYPQILSHSEETVRPRVLGLMDLGFTRCQVSKMIRSTPEILGVSSIDEVENKIAKFLGLGLTRSEAMEVMREAPDLVWLDFQQFVGEKLEWLRTEIKLGYVHISLILKRWPRVFVPPLQNLMETRKWFLDRGITPDGVSELCSRNIRVLVMSPKQLDDMFVFARDALKKSREEIFGCPAYFTFSLEKRVLMRVAFLDCNGEDYTKFSLDSLVLESRRNFDKRFGEARIKAFEDSWRFLSLDQKLNAIRTRSYT
ncbi:hypothetical protein BSKO_13549 [Bryopsis sp. KO-2023]|nr:hypothetical protein BSKO_13549 [Bryopsis sp. KO-2023]